MELLITDLLNWKNYSYSLLIFLYYFGQEKSLLAPYITHYSLLLLISTNRTLLITDPEKLRNTHYQYTAVPPSSNPPNFSDFLLFVELFCPPHSWNFGLAVSYLGKPVTKGYTELSVHTCNRVVVPSGASSIYGRPYGGAYGASGWHTHHHEICTLS